MWVFWMTLLTNQSSLFYMAENKGWVIAAITLKPKKRNRTEQPLAATPSGKRRSPPSLTTRSSSPSSSSHSSSSNYRHFDDHSHNCHFHLYHHFRYVHLHHRRHIIPQDHDKNNVIMVTTVSSLFITAFDHLITWSWQVSKHSRRKQRCRKK